MKTKTFADRLPKKDVATQKTDNTAASTGNSGTVKNGKGSEASCTINLHLSDSPVTIISTSGESSSNVITPPTHKKKAATQPTKGQSEGSSLFAMTLSAVLLPMALILLLTGIMKTDFVKNKMK